MQGPGGGGEFFRICMRACSSMCPGMLVMNALALHCVHFLSLIWHPLDLHSGEFLSSGSVDHVFSTLFVVFLL